MKTTEQIIDDVLRKARSGITTGQLSARTGFPYATVKSVVGSNDSYRMKHNQTVVHPVHADHAPAVRDNGDSGPRIVKCHRQSH